MIQAISTGRWRGAILAVLAGVFAAGCESGPPAGPVGPEAHRPQVERQVALRTVSFERDSARLTQGERAALVEFLRQRGDRRGLDLVVTAAASGEAIDRRRQNAVLRLLRSYGLQARAGDPLGARSVADNRVRVRAHSYRVRLADCPDLARDTIGGLSNRPSSNFGCADQRNLGLMVANPGDLLRGRRPGPANAERLGRPVRLYRLGKSYTPMTPEDREGADAAASGESGTGDFTPPQTVGTPGDDE